MNWSSITIFGRRRRQHSPPGPIVAVATTYYAVATRPGTRKHRPVNLVTITAVSYHNVFPIKVSGAIFVPSSFLVELSSCSEDEYDSEDSEKDFR